MSETDGFVQMIDWSNQFFTGLRANNTKDWFEPRKAEFITNVKKPSELFADLMADEISRMTGDSHTGKVFRIYRDVRFSKDKTPYNAHLHILWSTADAGPAIFFGSDPDGIAVLTGIMGFKGEGLTRYRAFVDANGDAIKEEIERADLTIADFGADPLKKVPKPFAPDHPHGDLLRRKSLILRTSLPDDWRETGLITATCAAIKTLNPIRALLKRAV